MAHTRSLVDGGGEDGARPMTAEATLAAENRLLRQQVQDMAGQLSALTKIVQQIARQTATLSTATQLPTPEPVVREAHVREAHVLAVGGDDSTPTQITMAGVSAVPATVPLDIPLQIAQGPMPGATVRDRVREAVITHSPTQSTVVVGGDPALHTERARVRANLAEFRKYKPSIFEGETTDPWVVEKSIDTMEKLFVKKWMA